MVVETGSAMAEVAEPPRSLIEWDKTHGLSPDAAVSPPQKTPWSMVFIRNHQDHGNGNPPIIFPPVNHENLHIYPDPPPTPRKIPHILADNRQILYSDSDSDSSSDSNSSSTFSPSDSSPAPRSPLVSTLRTRPFDSLTEILRTKVNYVVRLLCSGFTSSRGGLLTFRSAALTAVVIAFLYFWRRRRRRLRAGEETTDRLIGIIKERDEKINQLLDQISKMNQVLLALHNRVPTSPTT